MKTTLDFDERRILMAARMGSLQALRRAGAYVRGAAKRAVAISPVPAAPGKPPHSRAGLLKRGLLFGVEKSRMAVLVGPAYSFIGLSMTAHEYGGRFRGRQYPARPLMWPTLQGTAKQLPSIWKDCIK